MTEETRETLELLVEKAYLLAGGRFLNYDQAHGGTGIQISFKPDEVSIQSNLPDDEALQAFLTTFRMFYQPRDRISFVKLEANVLNDPGVSSTWKEGFKQLYQDMNQFLDRPSALKISIFGDVPTAREILETFLYGDHIHVNSDKRARWKQWMREPITAALLKAELNMILQDMFGNAIDYLTQITVQELAAHSAQGAS